MRACELIITAFARFGCGFPLIIKCQAWGGKLSRVLPRMFLTENLRLFDIFGFIIPISSPDLGIKQDRSPKEKDFLHVKQPGVSR